MFLLAHENEDEYRDLLAGLNAAHNPRDRHEEMLVQELADASWAWQRARATDQEFWDYVRGHYRPANAGIAEAESQEKEARFRTHLRHMEQAERQYYRALTAVERMHRNRDRGSAMPYKPFGKAAAAGATSAEPQATDAPLDQLATSHQPLATNSHAKLIAYDAPRRAPSPSSPRHATGLFLIPRSSDFSESPPLTPAGFSFSGQCNSITANSMASSPPSFRTPEAAAS